MLAVSEDQDCGQRPIGLRRRTTAVGCALADVVQAQANGSEHITWTIAPIGVTLTDVTTDTIFRLAGESWFGGNFNVVNGKYEFADTEFFNILGPSDGVVAKVAGVEHMGSGGSNFSFA